MRVFNASFNPFFIALLQVVIMGVAYIISFQKPLEEHFIVEIFILCLFWLITPNIKLHSIVISERLAPIILIFLFSVLIISVLNGFDYYHYVSNPIWVPLMVFVLSLIVHFRNRTYTTFVKILSFSIIVYSGSREYTLWFIFMHFLKNIVENHRVLSFHKLWRLLIIISMLMIVQYTFRTSDADYSLSELKLSIERTTTRIAYPVFVSNEVFKKESGTESDFNLSDFYDFLFPSAVSVNQKIVPGQEIQRIYFTRDSSVNLPLTFAGQAKHYFGRYWMIGMVIFLIVLFLVFTIIRGSHNNQISVTFYLIILFFMFRYDHGLYIINNIFKILPLVFITLFILEKLSFVKKVKNLTY